MGDSQETKMQWPCIPSCIYMAVYIHTRTRSGWGVARAACSAAELMSDTDGFGECPTRFLDGAGVSPSSAPIGSWRLQRAMQSAMREYQWRASSGVLKPNVNDE